MTLLITAIHREYSLCSSDQRISVQYGTRFRSVDERFNKHIYFGTDDYIGNISYTGVAQWRVKGRRFRLYDIISEAIAACITENPKLAPLCIRICDQLQTSLPTASALGVAPDFELHISTRQKSYPVNALTVISTFRKSPPWGDDDGEIYEWDFGNIRIFMKVMVEQSDVIFGGMEPLVRAAEKERIRHALREGADAFQCAKMAAQIIKSVAARTSAVGRRNVAIVVPANGYMDTNLWDATSDGLIGYMPRMVFSNGTMWGPSEFPVNLAILTNGQLPKHSLFFKSIVEQSYKRRSKRILFKRRKGPFIPGVIAMLGLAIFGSVKDGYDDFGLGSTRDLE